MKSVALSIDERSPQGIASGIARLITTGDLAPGDRLPTVRELASDLGVSPATVSHAWQTLASTGLITSRGRSGSFVRSKPREWMPRRYRGLDGTLEARLDLSRGTPDPELLPALGPALARVSARENARQRRRQLHGEARHPRAARPAARDLAVARRVDHRHQRRARRDRPRARRARAVRRPGARREPDLPAVHRPARALRPRADRRRRSTTRACGPRRSPPRSAAVPPSCCMQPRAHNPTGVSMTRARAEQLAVILRRSRRNGENAIVIEDDHSGAISTAPDVTLATWLPDRVLHVRSFSKSHGPDLRIGALGGPRALVDRVVARRLLGPGWTSRMTQALLFELLTDPDSVADIEPRARHLRGAAGRDWRRRCARHGVPFAAGDGINAWLRVADERDAIVQLTASGIRVAPGTPVPARRARRSRGGFVRVTVGVARDEVSRHRGGAGRGDASSLKPGPPSRLWPGATASPLERHGPPRASRAANRRSPLPSRRPPPEVPCPIAPFVALGSATAAGLLAAALLSGCAAAPVTASTPTPTELSLTNCGVPRRRSPPPPSASSPSSRRRPRCCSRSGSATGSSAPRSRTARFRMQWAADAAGLAVDLRQGARARRSCSSSSPTSSTPAGSRTSRPTAPASATSSPSLGVAHATSRPPRASSAAHARQARLRRGRSARSREVGAIFRVDARPTRWSPSRSARSAAIEPDDRGPHRALVLVRNATPRTSARASARPQLVLETVGPHEHRRATSRRPGPRSAGSRSSTPTPT